MRRRPRIGLALGSGSARGWSHIGVIRALVRAGFAPDIVCGSSIGALVGAVHAAGRLDWLEDWTRRLNWQGVLSLLDLRMGGGLIEGNRLVEFFSRHFEDRGIAQLPLAFGCVATELASGREVWLRDGPVIDAVRASIALPGLFTPALREGRLLVDGGLVNPVPVSLCRAMGADVVVAVDLNWDLVGRRARASDDTAVATANLAPPGPLAALLERLKPAPRAASPANGGGADAVPPPMPSLMDVLTTSLNIMQVRITQSRLAGEPADVLIRPRLSDIAAMDFDRAALAIAQGEKAVEQALPQLADWLG
ncbi:patatin-like phospholipase family protein [Pseudorhodoferax sp.]|uniref:patatin-like phospholipase family protein n=1 Tax=Pseudorhodoferax sp. TaxID=1993553 RepID=UPI0039E652E9